MSAFSGHLHLRAAARENGRTVLAAQAFRAPFHLSKPYWDAEARVLHVQVVNPTAGILAGDRLDAAIAVEREAALLVTTPSASRVFKMERGAAEGRQHFSVAGGGWLDVWPEPLVPHRDSVYRQETTLEVEPGGELLFVDQLLPGRLGHGEAWQWRSLRLGLTLRIGGELALRERFEASGGELQRMAALGGAAPGAAACFANAVLVSERAEAVEAVRPRLAALHCDGTWLGVSALRRGGWSLKIVAPDPIRLRATLREARRILADQFPRLRCDTRRL
jgi:urease accessory protein